MKHNTNTFQFIIEKVNISQTGSLEKKDLSSAETSEKESEKGRARSHGKERKKSPRASKEPPRKRSNTKRFPIILSGRKI